jgi:hypothetical protein
MPSLRTGRAPMSFDKYPVGKPHVNDVPDNQIWTGPAAAGAPTRLRGGERG